VTVGLGEVADIPPMVVERGCLVRGSEECRTTLARDEESPLVTGWVPVNFTHRAWLDRDNGRGETGGDGEGQRVDDLDATTGNFVRWLFRKVIGVGLGLRDNACRVRHVLLLDILRSGGPREDVEFISRKVVKGRNREI